MFRTAEGTKHREGPRAPVAFEIDQFDRETRSGWSVVVHGWLDELETSDADELANRIGVDPWATGPKPHVMCLWPTSITGRRVG